MHGTRMRAPEVTCLRNMIVKVIAWENTVQANLLENMDLKDLC